MSNDIACQYWYNPLSLHDKAILMLNLNGQDNCPFMKRIYHAKSVSLWYRWYFQRSYWNYALLFVQCTYIIWKDVVAKSLCILLSFLLSLFSMLDCMSTWICLAFIPFPHCSLFLFYVIAYVTLWLFYTRLFLFYLNSFFILCFFS